MKKHAGPRLRIYATAGVLGLVASLAVGQPEPAIAGVALLVLVVVGLEAFTPKLNVSIRDAPSAMIEGEDRSISLQVEADRPTGGVVLDLALSEGLSAVAVDQGRLLDRTTVELDVAGSSIIDIRVQAESWGGASLGPIVARVRPNLSVLEYRHEFDEWRRMVAVPAALTVSELLAPQETNLHSGDLVSRSMGPGLEFAELRPHQTGDDPRHLNWRVSSRSGSWWVNERHPERSGDVLVVVDAQTQPETGIPSLVDRAVRMAGALLREYGRRRYRIGLVTIDGVVRWVGLGSGEAHRRHILGALLAIQEGSSNRHAIERAVLRAAKRPALVIVLTPLLDDSMAGIAHSLRTSGLDMAVVELEPSADLPEPTNSARTLGRRLWALERDRLRDRLAGEGIPVVPWTAGQPPEVPLSQLTRWRTSWRLPA